MPHTTHANHNTQAQESSAHEGKTRSKGTQDSRSYSTSSSTFRSYSYSAPVKKEKLSIFIPRAGIEPIKKDLLRVEAVIIFPRGKKEQEMRSMANRINLMIRLKTQLRRFNCQLIIT